MIVPPVQSDPQAGGRSIRRQESKDSFRVPCTICTVECYEVSDVAVPLEPTEHFAEPAPYTSLAYLRHAASAHLAAEWSSSSQGDARTYSGRLAVMAPVLQRIVPRRLASAALGVLMGMK